MKKPSDYNVMMIDRLESELWNTLTSTIYGMIDDEDEIELGFTIGTTEYQTLTISRDEEGNIEDTEITSQYLDTDGLIYTDYDSVEDLPLGAKWELYKVLKNMA